jgi:hypothetical protein
MPAHITYRELRAHTEPAAGALVEKEPRAFLNIPIIWAIRRIALETNELNALDIANGFPPAIRSGRSLPEHFDLRVSCVAWSSVTVR